MRGRAPLFMAQFDEKDMEFVKETERVIVPYTGAGLGNFGALILMCMNHGSLLLNRWIIVRQGANGKVKLRKFGGKTEFETIIISYR